MKKLLAVLSIFAFVFGLASCGGENTQETKPANLDENGVPTENVTVVFWHTMGKENQIILDGWIEEFTAMYPNIKIEHAAQGGYDDINDKIKKYAKQHNFQKTPDEMGYYMYFSNYNAYIEIIPYNKMIQDSKKRNKILFDKLFNQ